MIELEEVTESNKQWINKIKGKDTQLHLVHYNAYWYGQSLINDNINFLLIKYKQAFVGVVSFGQYYLDAYLQQKEAGIGEIIHIVIDAKHQGKGHAKQTAKKVIALLKDEGYSKIYVAVSEENKISNNLWLSLSFQLTTLKNYDGDAILELIN